MSEPGKAVFLSYASQDSEAALRLCSGLRAAGVEVWFDQNELVGGDAWDQKIRKQIKECALFVPIISANTQARREGYFRIEWKLAAQRTHGIAEGTPFLLPVLIDDTPEPEALVPAEFREVQWTRLRPLDFHLRQGSGGPDGGQARVGSADSLDAFCERVGRLLSGEGEAAGSGARTTDQGPRTMDDGRPNMDHGRRSTKTDAGQRPALPRWLMPAIAAGAVVVVAALFFRHAFNPEPKTQNPEPKTQTPELPRAAAAVPLSEAQRLVAQARSIYDKIGYTRDDLALADDLCRRATELEPTSADTWAARAYVGATYFNRGWDRSEARARNIQGFASRALALDPKSVEALVAQGMLLANRNAALTEVEPFFRRAISAAPTDVRPWRFLGNFFSLRGENDLAVKTFDEAARIEPRDVLTQYNLATHYASRGELAVAFQHAERALALAPDFGGALLLKAALAIREYGDLAAMRKAIDGLPVTERSDDRSVYFAMWAGLLERNVARVQAAAALGTNDYLNDNLFRGPKAWLLAMAFQAAGQQASARQQWQAAELVLRRRLADGTGNGPIQQAQLAYTLAQLGQLDEAARLIAPFETVAREQPSVPNHFNLARYQAARGDAAAAVPHLRYLLTNLANGGYGGFTVHLLRLEPEWDKLRGQPAFEELLQEAGSRRAEDGRRRAEDGGQTAEPTNAKLPTPNSERSNPPVADAKSVAVLAFANLSDDKDNEYFSDGISEELLNVLAKVPGLKVSARTSAFSFKGKGVAIPEIAKQLGVAYVVEGSVRKAGNRVRITAQLIKASDGFHVWSDNFDRELKDIFAVQDEIAGIIARELQLKLSTAPRVMKPANPEAHRLVLEGRYQQALINEEAFARAEPAFLRAISLDPDFADAHAALASMSISRATIRQMDSHLDWQEDLRRAKEEASIALRLDPNQVLARSVFGSALLLERKPKESEESLRKALLIDPNSAVTHMWLGNTLGCLGRPDEAIAEFRRALELDPLWFSARVVFSCRLGNAGQWAEALEVVDHAMTLRSESYLPALGYRMYALYELGRVGEAVELARVIRRRPEVSGRWHFDGVAIATLRRAGFEKEAMEYGAQILAWPELPAESYVRGFVLGGLGRFEEARPYLERSPTVMTMGPIYDSMWDEWRDTPGFQRLMTALGMTEEYRVARETRARLLKAVAK